MKNSSTNSKPITLSIIPTPKKAASKTSPKPTALPSSYFFSDPNIVVINRPIRINNNIEVDVPHDGSCLFWAVALNYLLPVVTNPTSFQQQFERLFGVEQSLHRYEIQKLLQNYRVDQSDIFYNRTLDNLVRVIFRSRVMNYISQRRANFEPFLENNETWNNYLIRMQGHGWGGNIEIMAMRDILNCYIDVAGYQLNDGIVRDNIRINLVHLPGGKNKSAHYHYLINENNIPNKDYNCLPTAKNKNSKNTSSKNNTSGSKLSNSNTTNNQIFTKPKKAISILELIKLINTLATNSGALQKSNANKDIINDLKQQLDIIKSYFQHPEMVISAGFHGGLSHIRNKYGVKLLRIGLLINKNLHLTEEESKKVFKGMTLLAQTFKVKRAYTDIYKGIKFTKAGLPKFNKEHPLFQANPIKHLSQQNINRLITELKQPNDIDDFGLRQDEHELFNLLFKLPYKLQHATNAYYQLMNQGSLDSYTEINRQNPDYVSPFSTGGNIDKLGNKGFIFFRVYVDPINNSQTRYGDTSIIFDLNLLKDCGWVSLHDQLKPFSTPGATRYYYGNRLIRAADVVAIKNNTKDEALHDGILYKYRTSPITTYKGSKDTQKSVGSKIKVRQVTRSFLEEIFYGEDILLGIALSIIRELRYLEPCGFRQSILLAFSQANDTEKVSLLGNLIKDLFRIEGKYPVALRSQTNINVNKQHFTHIARSTPKYNQISQTINPDGDGRCNPDNTVNSAANHLAQLRAERKIIGEQLSILRRQNAKFKDNKEKTIQLTEEITAKQARWEAINIELGKDKNHRVTIIKYFCEAFNCSEERFAKVDTTKLDLINEYFTEHLEYGYASIDDLINLPSQTLTFLGQELYYDLIIQEHADFTEIVNIPYGDLLTMANSELQMAIEERGFSFQELVELYYSNRQLFEIVTCDDLDDKILELAPGVNDDVLKYAIEIGVDLEWVMDQLGESDQELFKLDLTRVGHYQDEPYNDSNGYDYQSEPNSEEDIDVDNINEYDQTTYLEDTFLDMMAEIKANIQENYPHQAKKIISLLVNLSYRSEYNYVFQGSKDRQYTIEHLFNCFIHKFLTPPSDKIALNYFALRGFFPIKNVDSFINTPQFQSHKCPKETRTLISQLEKNQITNLNLSNKTVDSISFIKLMLVLISNTSVTTIDLEECEITLLNDNNDLEFNSCILALVDALLKPNIQRVYFWDCSLLTDSIESNQLIVAAVYHNNNIIEISINMAYEGGHEIRDTVELINARLAKLPDLE